VNADDDRRRSYGAIRGNPRDIGRRCDVVVGPAATRHEVFAVTGSEAFPFMLSWTASEALAGPEEYARHGWRRSWP